MKRRRPSRGASGAGKQGSASGKLHGDDELLWNHAAQTIEPVRAMKPRVPDRGAGVTDPASPPLRHATVVVDAPKPAPARADHRHAPPPHPVRAKVTHAAPPLSEFDRRKARRLATGKLDIEARIDLHGLRQSEAHQQLRGFLMACVGRGLSTVLVITGKGAKLSDEPRPFDHPSETSDRGVLKRMVPHWLAEPDMRAIVVGFHAAGIRHGGDGAMYVQLRKRIRV